MGFPTQSRGMFKLKTHSPDFFFILYLLLLLLLFLV